MLLDFVSVMINNKRENNFNLDSKVNFKHNSILEFLEKHKEFVIEDQVLRIFILSRRFRLSLEFLIKNNIPFHIDFFKNAINASAFDIAFYLLGLYEEQIYLNANEAVNCHVTSYQLSKKYLKSKLHMSKQLMVVFNFSSAKKFLDTITAQIHDTTLEGNLFGHSNNPLLNMCLLYELFLLLIKKFYSLNNQCRVLMKITMELMLNYIDSVDDENFLTTIMLEKDFSGRDILRIAVELELLELIQCIKVEGSIKAIYNSNFD